MAAFVIGAVFSLQIVKKQASVDEDSSDSRFWGHALSPCTFLRLQTPGGVTAVCWHANVSPTTLQLLRFPHLSQDMFITHSFGPKISVRTTRPGCVMNPPAACLVIYCFRSKGLLPPLSSLPLLLYVLHISTPLFFILFFIFLQRNISQQGCAQQGSKLRLQRMSHYHSRWCANVAEDIKVFQLIIIRGIRWRQLSLSYNLATICGILAEQCWCNSMVTLS